MINGILSCVIFLILFVSFIPISTAEIIPFYKVVSAESFEVPAKIDSRLYVPNGTITAVMVYTTSSKVSYQINGESLSMYGGFTLDHLKLITLTKEQALLFRVTHNEQLPQRITVLYLDIYPF